eukprot:scaffold1112_cov116-Isochrysis_galbana.AAC.19
MTWSSRWPSRDLGTGGGQMQPTKPGRSPAQSNRFQSCNGTQARNVVRRWRGGMGGRGMVAPGCEHDEGGNPDAEQDERHHLVNPLRRLLGAVVERVHPVGDRGDHEDEGEGDDARTQPEGRLLGVAAGAQKRHASGVDAVLLGDSDDEDDAGHDEGVQRARAAQDRRSYGAHRATGSIRQVANARKGVAPRAKVAVPWNQVRTLEGHDARPDDRPTGQEGSDQHLHVERAEQGQLHARLAERRVIFCNHLVPGGHEQSESKGDGRHHDGVISQALQKNNSQHGQGR